MEIWKDIKEYNGLYQVSNIGRVRGLDRYARVCGGGMRLVKGRILKPMKCTNEYEEVCISVGRKRKVHLIHRLVAEAFIDNPNNLPQVNHKDEDIKNNNVDNLEWCTAKYNANYGTRNQRCYEKVIKKAVRMCDLAGNEICTFDSIKLASREMHIYDSQIIRVCKGRNKTAGGFLWSYV